MQGPKQRKKVRSEEENAIRSSLLMSDLKKAGCGTQEYKNKAGCSKNCKVLTSMVVLMIEFLD